MLEPYVFSEVKINKDSSFPVTDPAKNKYITNNLKTSKIILFASFFMVLIHLLVLRS